MLITLAFNFPPHLPKGAAPEACQHLIVRAACECICKYIDLLVALA